MIIIYPIESSSEFHTQWSDVWDINIENWVHTQHVTTDLFSIAATVLGELTSPRTRRKSTSLPGNSRRFWLTVANSIHTVDAVAVRMYTVSWPLYNITSWSVRHEWSVLHDERWRKVVIEWLLSLNLFTTTMPSTNRNKKLSCCCDSRCTDKRPPDKKPLKMPTPDKRPPGQKTTGQKTTKMVFLWRNLKSPDYVVLNCIGPIWCWV